MTVGTQVQFAENEEHTTTLGVVTRVWDNGKYVTIVSDGHTFVRLIKRVTAL
jgi:hypothetical protein